MADLVGTCPKGFWEEWLVEGDCAGEPATAQEYEWHTGSRLISKIGEDDRFYIVAHGKLRGWATVIAVHRDDNYPGGIIVRAGGAVACTIPKVIPGFRGLRKRWWPRETEVPFPDWRTP